MHYSDLEIKLAAERRKERREIPVVPVAGSTRLRDGLG